MSDNWVVQNLQNALDTWNKYLSEIWQLITQSPEQFKGGSIWGVIVNIHDAVRAIGLALLVLFFVVGVMRTCGSFADVKFHLRTRADMPLLRTEYRTCNKHLLLTERNG